MKRIIKKNIWIMLLLDYYNIHKISKIFFFKFQINRKNISINQVLMS